MKILLAFLSFFVIFNVFSIEIKANLWEKDICPSNQICLPVALREAQSFSIAEPANNSFSRLHTQFGAYKVILTFTKRIDPIAYYSFQVEIGTEEYPQLAVCSRFEGLDTLENAMVGACAAKIPLKNKLIGLSLQLP